MTYKPELLTVGFPSSQATGFITTVDDISSKVSNLEMTLLCNTLTTDSFKTIGTLRMSSGDALKLTVSNKYTTDHVIPSEQIRKILDSKAILDLLYIDFQNYTKGIENHFLVTSTRDSFSRAFSLCQAQIEIAKQGIEELADIRPLA